MREVRASLSFGVVPGPESVEADLRIGNKPAAVRTSAMLDARGAGSSVIDDVYLKQVQEDVETAQKWSRWKSKLEACRRRLKSCRLRQS